MPNVHVNFPDYDSFSPPTQTQSAKMPERRTRSGYSPAADDQARLMIHGWLHQPPVPVVVALQKMLSEISKVMGHINLGPCPPICPVAIEDLSEEWRDLLRKLLAPTSFLGHWEKILGVLTMIIERQYALLYRTVSGFEIMLRPVGNWHT